MRLALCAQISFMRALMAEGLAGSTDIVFLDMDVLVVDSLGEVRGSPYTLWQLCWSSMHAGRPAVTLGHGGLSTAFGHC